MINEKKRHFLTDRKVSVTRIEGFSDGLIAIIITLMILEIPLPTKMNTTELLEFGKSVLIYFASFVVVGTQWNKHHLLLEKVKTVSYNFIWKNLLYLFSLSLVPLLMKWLIQCPDNVIPAISYSVIYLATDIISRQLFVTILKEKKSEADRMLPKNRKTVMQLFPMVLFILLLILAFYYPETAIVFFIVFPVSMSVIKLVVA